MKKIAVLISVVVIAIIITMSSCKKDDPVPAEKKKYAWVTGAQDSTGYGMILFTPDAGETWVRQGQGSAALQGIDVSDIWAVDENNVWATGTGNTILRTTDGGQTWTQVQPPANLPDAGLSPIYIVNKSDIWIGGGCGTAGNGMVYKSIDGGSTWTMLDTAFFHKNGIQGLWAINPEKVYAVGGHYMGGLARGFIGYTLDGGLTWDSISPANNFNKWEWIGVVASENTTVIYGTKAHYMVSTDGGNTWINDSVPNTGGMDGADINDLIMLDSQTWWGAFDMGQIIITTDGGTTWTKQQTPGIGGTFAVGIDTWDGQLALAVPFADFSPARCPIIKTENGGALWEKKITINSQLWKVSFIKD